MEVGFGFIVVGICFACVAGLLFLRARRFTRTAITTTGTVVAQAESTGSEGSVSFAPIVQFATVEGRTVRFTGHLGTNPPSHAIGDTISVSYDRTDPERARITRSILFVPGLLAAIGLAFFVGGVIVIVVAGLV